MEKLQKIQNCLEENGIEVLNDGTLCLLYIYSGTFN